MPYQKKNGSREKKKKKVVSSSSGGRGGGRSGELIVWYVGPHYFHDPRISFMRPRDTTSEQHFGNLSAKGTPNN